MALSVSNKSLTTNILRNLDRTNSKIGRSVGKLASGKRILKASDDAAGLAIAERLKSDVRVLKKTVENVAQGLSLTKVAEGSLQNISQIIGEAKALATQASTGTLNESQRSALQKQINSFNNEINRIVESTEFNGNEVLNGDLSQNAPEFNIQAGLDNTASSKINLNVIPNLNAENLGLANIDLSSQASAQNALENLENANQNVINVRGEIGAIQQRFASITQTQKVSIEQLTSATSKITNADFAAEISLLRESQILLNTSLQGLKQTQFASKTIGNLLNITA